MYYNLFCYFVDTNDPGTIMALAVKFARSIWVREQRKSDPTFGYNRYKRNLIPFPQHEAILEWYDNYRMDHPSPKRTRCKPGKSPITVPPKEEMETREPSAFEQHLKNKFLRLSERLGPLSTGRLNNRELARATRKWEKETPHQPVPENRELIHWLRYSFKTLKVTTHL